MNSWKPPFIIAVDFDGTLFGEVLKSEYPAFGEPNKPLISALKSARRNGAKLILWTMRENVPLEVALIACRGEGLEFDSVNDNLPEMKNFYKNNPRKIYADVYLDNNNVVVNEFFSSEDKLGRVFRDYKKFGELGGADSD